MKTPKKSSPSVGQQIRSARKLVGLTLDVLGQQIGISIQALSAIERGKANPSKQTLIGLARILGNDFGESWLKRYATGTRKSTHRQLLDEAMKAHSPEGVRSPIPNIYLESILEWSFESRDAAALPRPVSIFNQKSALMPIHYEIANGTTLNTNEDNYKVVVPFSLIPSVEKARCVRVNDSPIRDALLGAGDILVILENSVPENNKIVLAIIDNKVLVRRWELNGRKVIFTALDTDYPPITVPRKNVEFIGDVLGVLRFISTVPVPFFN